MAMTKREKILAIGVAGVVGVLGIQFVISRVQAGITLKENQLASIESRIDEHNRKLTDSKLATKRLLDLQSRSLPSDPEAANNQYSAWLMQLAKECNLQNAKLDPLQSGGLRSPAYTAYAFALSGEIRLDDLVKLLHGYYNRDYLHRIRGLNVTQLPTNPELAKIKLETQAIALTKASPMQEPSLAASGRLNKSVAEYQNDIFSRNPFGPPNQAPRFALGRSVDVPRDREYELELKAEDPDKRHQIRYALVSEKPEGLRFDSNTGKIRWTPRTNGSYELMLEAIDTGLPPKKTEHKLTLKVVDPPAPPPPPKVEPSFDVASQSYVSGVMRGINRDEVWIRSKTENQKWELGVGDTIEVGSIKGKVIHINPNQQFAEVETDGRRWILSMDDASLLVSYKRAFDD